MISPATKVDSDFNDGISCSAATTSSILSDVIVCLDMNTDCMHALPCDSACYCAHHVFYQ